MFVDDFCYMFLYVGIDKLDWTIPECAGFIAIVHKGSTENTTCLDIYVYVF